MTPEISEFSFGFALTNQIVSWVKMHAAPIFPSLIEEGKPGGGYDVKLDWPGIPLYLQFKRGYPMVKSSALEIQSGKTNLQVPFHRFHITESGRSDQHAMLLALDQTGAKVFYAAPRFDSRAQLSDLWSRDQVAQHSIFVRPSAIGSLDANAHHVAYDRHHTYLCSDPKPIASLNAMQLIEELSLRLSREHLPLSDQLTEYEWQLGEAKQQAKNALIEMSRGQASLVGSVLLGIPDASKERELPEIDYEIPSRRPTRLSEPQLKLRAMADKALRDFDAQLVIVQNTNGSY